MEFDELDDLYRDAILDHCRSPRNRERVEDADIQGDSVNPFCGDEIHLQIKLDGDQRVSKVGLQGEGCSINQATGSMLSEQVKGKTLEEIESQAHLFRRMMQEDVPEAELEGLGHLQALASVRQFPVRIKCALLAWSALEEGLEDYRRGRG